MDAILSPDFPGFGDPLQMRHLKRKRKSNYSARETQALIREIRRRRDVLFSRQQNTAINELKRRAWEEVAERVNALGEGELRTAAEVKRRYLDWRALMKRKRLCAELSELGNGDELSSPDSERPLGAGDQSLEPSAPPKDEAYDWRDLPDPGGTSDHASPGIRLEDEGASCYRLGNGTELGVEEEDDEEDCFPSLLPDEIREGGGVSEAFAHIDEFGKLSGSRAPAVRDPGAGLSAGLMGFGVAGSSRTADGTGLIIALESQRLDLERRRLQTEAERLQVEKQRLLVEREKLRQTDVERERLQVQRERLQVEKERLRLLVFQAERPPPAPSLDGEKERKPWEQAQSQQQQQAQSQQQQQQQQQQQAQSQQQPADLEAERLQLEKERLQFFKFETGRLQIEKERLQVERERLRLHTDSH